MDRFATSLTTLPKSLAHELGHALGWYGHSDEIVDVMFYDKIPAPDDLSLHDIDHLQQLYE